MSDSGGEQQSPKKKLGSIGRRSVHISQAELVSMEPLAPDTLLPLVITPATDHVDLNAWAKANQEQITTQLMKHGGLLLRGFHIPTIQDFQAFMQTLAPDLLDYTYRSTPRSQVEGQIYTSTEYPADQSIPMHNEMSYTTSWPMKIWFYCVTPAEQGGETPLADSRRVYQRLDPALRERFAAKGVMYVRNYGQGIDLSWQNVFQTDDKQAVEQFCQEHGIDFVWTGEDQLRTKQVCQAVAQHPTTGETVWFNQAHLFHVTSLPEQIRTMLLAEFTEEDLPRNTYYGDGTPIEAAALEEIRRAYAEESVQFPWQQGDIVMLDNMLVAHGRGPFSGQRKIVVGMAEACESTQV